MEPAPHSVEASPARVRAVIDVGTNSVKLLVARVTNGSVEPVFERGEQTRLGRGFYRDQRLRPEGIAHTAEAVGRFVRLAREHGAAEIRAVATSAAREARNAGELVQAIAAAADLSLEVISGETEAEWVWRGVRSQARFAAGALLVTDVGGGSTEFLLGEAEQPVFARSFPLGTVRLMEELDSPADPPGAGGLAECRRLLRERLRERVLPELDPALRMLHERPRIIVGTGGTTTILARMKLQLADYDRERLEAVRFDRTDLSQTVERLWSQTAAQRRELAGLPPDRADVILFGAAIYEAMLEVFAVPSLRVSTRGMRFGALAG